MDIKKVISQLKDLIHSGAGVQFSFGTPSQIGDTAIIPVARISFAFGGGGGSSAAKSKHKSKKTTGTVAEEGLDAPEPEASENEQKEDIKNPDFGGGGGGSIKTDPVGIYTIKGDKVKFHPVVSVKEIVAIFAVVSLLLIKLLKLRKTRK